MPDVQELGSWVQLTHQAIRTIKTAIGMLPSGAERDAAQQQLEEAERKLQIAEARAATKLGYEICDCIWPPAIMLRQTDGSRKCPNCGRRTGETASAEMASQESALELDHDAVRILTVMYEEGETSAATSITLPYLHFMTELPKAKIEYYLEELAEEEYIIAFYNMYEDTRYELDQKGRRYLIKQGVM